MVNKERWYKERWLDGHCHCDYSFKKGDVVICKNNIGRSEFVVGKEYIVNRSIHEYGSYSLEVCDENRAYTSAFASRFTTLKIERTKKLKKLNEIWKDVNH